MEWVELCDSEKPAASNYGSSKLFDKAYKVFWQTLTLLELRPRI